MSNNIFYKALATVSTVGIVVIAGIHVTTALKKGNTTEDQLSKTMVEINKARKDALAEVKAIKSEVLNELDTVRANSLNEIKTDRTNALVEVKGAKSDALKSIKKAGGSQVGSVWLVIRYISGAANTRGSSLEKIRMIDMDHCQEQGAKWMAAPRMKYEKKTSEYSRLGFICLEES